MSGGASLRNAEIGVGIVGAGGVAEWHASALAQIAGARLEAVFDVDAARMNRFAERFGVKRQLPSAAAMQECDVIEAVFICTPNAYHAPLASASLAARKHVFVEKPLATTLAEALRVVEDAGNSDRVLQVGHITRFDSELQVMREVVRRGLIGRILRVRAVSFADFIPSAGWYISRKLSGGGVLMDIGVHALDALSYVLGDPAARKVYATTRTALGSYDVEDTLSALINFEGGVVATLEAGYGTAAVAGGSSATLELFGTRGYARTRPLAVHSVDSSSNLLPQVAEDGVGAAPTDTAGLFLVQDSSFVSCCRNGSPGRVGAEVGAMVMRIVDAIYRSSASGEACAVNQAG
jgi:predicted dehydrogenase